MEDLQDEEVAAVPLADQSRWNTAHGTANLSEVERHPERFIIDPASLTTYKREVIDELGDDLVGKRVLELGSGRGELAIAIAKRGAEVTGVDVGADLVLLSQKVAEVNGVDCRFVCASIDDLGFPSNTFDVVVGTAILHHLSEAGVRAALQESRRVLRPGGKAVFYEPIENYPWFDSLQNLVPLGKPGQNGYRPSRLNRREWADWLEKVDDRPLTDGELHAAGACFDDVELRHDGLTVRLSRLWRNRSFTRALLGIDRVLTHKRSPVRSFARSAFITYR